jgi:hypothetical protein
VGVFVKISSFQRAAILASSSLAVLALAGCGAVTSGALPGGSPNASTAVQRAPGGVSPGAISNPYPFVQGDVFKYAYSETDTTKSSGSTVVSYVDGTTVATVGPMKTFDGHKLTDFNEVYTFTDSDSGHTTTATGKETTDRFRTFATGEKSTLDYESYGDKHVLTVNDTDGDSESQTGSYTYGGAFWIDVLPETKNDSWVEETANTQINDTTRVTSGVTDKETEKFTEQTDGSYVRDYTSQKTGEGQYVETDTQDSDGSGSDVNNGKTNPTAGTTTFAAPAKVGGKYVITVVYTPPTGPPTTTEVPDWFPGHALLEKLTSDTKKDIGPKAVPSTCGKATAGQAAELLSESYLFLDVVIGKYYLDATDTYVVSGEGVACVIEKQTTDTYDNLATGALLSSETVATISGLTSETLKKLNATHEIVGFAPWMAILPPH